MMTISLTTIIAGAVVVLLAILGSLINPFLRSLRFPEIEEADVDSEGVTEDGSSNESKSSEVESGANRWHRSSSHSKTLVCDKHVESLRFPCLDEGSTPSWSTNSTDYQRFTKKCVPNCVQFGTHFLYTYTRYLLTIRIADFSAVSAMSM